MTTPVNVQAAPRFALNHMTTPNLPPKAFFALAADLGLEGVEIRNDLEGNAILDGAAPETIRAMADEAGVAILTINALQKFNTWTDARAREAEALADYAGACGARALVLVPNNDGSGRANGERQANLRVALKELAPILKARGVAGLVEPLGFESCSLRLKSEAADAIAAVGASDVFRLVHDTFHHHLAGETRMFPAITGLVHISGVEDQRIGVSDMRDGHRVLVGEGDRLDNAGQMRALIAGGYDGVFSFEPFSPSVHGLADPKRAVADSIAFLRRGLMAAAA